MTTMTTAPRHRTFQALADENRLAVLESLLDGERCVCELTEATGLKQSLLSFHLGVLRNAGLVRDRRVGRWSFYSIDLDTVDELRKVLGRLGQAANVASRCCNDPDCECRPG